jgi:hypothetical protein
MFRVAKKKPNHRAAARRHDEDDEDDHQHQEHEPRVFSSSGAVSSSSVPPPERQSNGVEQEDDEEEEGPRVVIRRLKDKPQTERNRKRGLSVLKGDDSRKKTKKLEGLVSSSRSSGSRGGLTTFIDEDELDTFPAVESPQSTGARQELQATPVYGKEALEALKAAQSVAKPKELEEPPTTWPAPLPSNDELSGHVHDQASVGAVDVDDDASFQRNRNEHVFLSFNGNDPTEGEEDNVLLATDGKPIILEDPDDHNWEEQVAKRAGISTTSTSTTSNTTSRLSTISRAAMVTPTLEALRQNLHGTVDHLSKREEELSLAVMRRQADLAQTIADHKRHEQSIETFGKACNDYQQLRYNLAMWVGALRDLDAKVRPIQKSMLEMVSLHFEAIEQGWKNWQDDVCATLDQFGLLDRVLGRTPSDLGTQAEVAQQDEFGRDIGSQLKRDRENRFRYRQKRAQDVAKKHGRHDEVLERLLLREEGFDRRYDLLQEALRVAVEDLDDTYASPRKLYEHFEAWNKDYPDDYRQCYANLSLADLLNVFEQVEFCGLPWFRIFLKDSDVNVIQEKLFPLTSALVPEEGDGEESAKACFERVYSKEFVPFLKAIFRENPVVVFLGQGLSQFFGNAIAQIMDRVGYESECSKELCAAIGQSAGRMLQDLSIPLLKPSCGVAHESNDTIVDSLDFVKKLQPMWIHDLLMNLLNTWMPMIRNVSIDVYVALGKVILGFISETYLYFLSSLSDNQMAIGHVSPIWKLMLQSHMMLLESPDFVQHSAPLRAAALAYGLPATESLN